MVTIIDKILKYQKESPVAITNIANEFNLKCYTVDNMCNNIVGALVKNKNKWVIVTNTYYPSEYRRLVIAFILANYIIYKKEIINEGNLTVYDCNNYFFSSSIKDSLEENKEYYEKVYKLVESLIIPDKLSNKVNKSNLHIEFYLPIDYIKNFYKKY